MGDAAVSKKREVNRRDETEESVVDEWMSRMLDLGRQWGSRRGDSNSNSKVGILRLRTAQRQLVAWTATPY